MISPSHIKQHGITSAEYKERFPGAKLRIQTDASKAKISETKSGKTTKLKGRPKSPEAIENQRQSLLKSYASGSITHWNTGRVTPDTVKKKISEGNIGATNIGNQKQREKKYSRMHAGAAQYGCSILSIDIDVGTALAQCNTCQTEFSYTHQVFYPTRLEATQKLCPSCQPRSTFSSKSERELADFIEQCTPSPIIRNDRSTLGGFELDIFVPTKNIGFEFTGLYWHAEKQNDKKHHLLWKMQMASKLGIQVITIFEDEWLNKREIVESRVRGLLGAHSTKIFARQCKVKEISNSDSREFLDKNHVQGKDSATVRLGLFNNTTLVQVATFKKTNIVKGGSGKEWELSRLCSVLDTRVIGGASKLISYFMKHVNVEKKNLISYADRRWSHGHLYETIGFEFLSNTAPSYWYLVNNYKKRVHRSAYMKHRLVKTEEDKALTEWELAQRHGLDRIWDCGTTKWKLPYYQI